MKKYLSFFGICLLMFITNISAQGYNGRLADSLKADDYGMRMYALIILKTGQKTSTDKKYNDSLFAGHMKNIGRLVEQKKLIVAGPMKKNDRSYRGIFILDATMEEAKQLVFTDPAISAGLLDAELYEWYGSAALPMYLKYHEQVEKKSH